MTESVLQKLKQAALDWHAPELGADMPHGDMPGDKIVITPAHAEKADILFPLLVPLLEKSIAQSPVQRTVVAVCGGSGVGKSETASLLAYYLQKIGVGCYVLSGDNYPHRIPAQNDAERMRIYRCGGIRGMLTAGRYTKERGQILRELQLAETDADPARVAEFPWLAVYQQAARDALAGYLGSSSEQDFAQLTDILAQFKAGAQSIWLKRMGRTPEALWYDKVDLSDVSVLIVEWTHGNSEKFQGVDIPILLNSTPEETRQHRRERNRDGKVDSAFTSVVLELEQKMLEAQASRAKIILAKNGDVLSYPEYRALMAGQV